MNIQKIQAYQAGHVRLEEAELPQHGENEVLLETLYSTISPGTELAWLHHMANTPGIYPYYPGYSLSARVIAKGSEVCDLEIGDIVAVPAGHSSHHIVAADKCTKLPEGICPKEASAFRLASIALQGIRKADQQLGDRVAVLGLGAIGNLAAQLSYVAGAGEVSGFDLVTWRRSLAEQCGIGPTHADTNQPEHESLYDVVIEATGAAAVVNSAMQMVRPLGVVVLLGSARGLTDGVNFYRDVHRKGISLIGAHEMHRSYCEADRFGHFRSHKQDEEVIIKLLSQRRISLAPLVSEVVKPTDAQDIYDRLLKQNAPLMLASFQWGA